MNFFKISFCTLKDANNCKQNKKDYIRNVQDFHRALKASNDKNEDSGRQ